MEINAEARLPSASEAGAAPFQHTGTGGDAATHKGSGQRETDATDRVSQSRHSLSDADREQAIKRSAALVEYLHALAQLHWALLNGQGDYFTHKAAYDLALSDCHAARGIMERLIKGRSAAQVARMERERGLDLPACANEERAN